MKRVLAVLAAAAVAAVVLLHPVPPPTAAGTATAWSSAGPGAHGAPSRTPAPQAMVYVAGEVVRPGVYPVRADARARDALALAGGSRLTPTSLP